MTPARLALLLSPALPLAPVLLVLSACGGEPSKASERRGAPAAPLGFELAMAGVNAIGGSRDTVVDTPVPRHRTPLPTR